MRDRVRSRVLVGAAVLLGVAFRPGDARSDAPTLAGTWSAGGRSETVTVPAWIDDCGPKPKAGGGGGGSYTVTISGDELIFSGPHPFRTDQCYEQGPARRVSHSANPAIRWWKTRCESPPGDPLKAAITTVVRAANDDTLVMSESAHYSSTLKGTGDCTADYERSQTFKIVSRAGAVASASTTASTTASVSAAPTPAPSPTPSPVVTASAKPPSTPVCETLGEPATLEVRPKRKIIRPGEQFDFRGRVLDGKGCELSNKVSFRLAPESSVLSATVVVDPSGHVKVRADAEPASVSLVAEGAAKLARVELEVVSDQRYAELLGTGGLDDAGVDDQAVSVVVSGGVGVGTGGNTLMDPQGEGSRRRFALLAIVTGTCALLALAGLVLFRRGGPSESRRRRERRADAPLPAGLAAVPATPDTQPMQPLAPTPLSAPAPTSLSAGATAAPPGPGPRSCPTCAAVFPPEAVFCPHDGSRLVEAPAHAKAPAPAPEGARPGKICPVCGKRYGRESAFCGRDGVELVPLN